MYELALRSRFRAGVVEHPDAIADARPAKLGHRQPDLDIVREFEWREVSAARLGRRDRRRDVLEALFVARCEPGIVGHNGRRSLVLVRSS